LVTGLQSVYKQIDSVFTDKASNFYLQIPSDLLSEPYDLLDGDVVRGEVSRLVDFGFERNEFIDMPITLILRRSTAFDHLYISKKEWQTQFRDRGLVRPTYQLNLRLIDVVKADGKSIRLYPETTVGPVS